MSSEYGNPGFPPYPCVVHFAITSSPKKHSLARILVRVPIFPSLLTRCSLLLSVSSTDESWLLFIAEDGNLLAENGVDR